MKIKAIVFDKPNSVCLGEFELGSCGNKEIIAETIFSFVSPGTELRVLTGKQPNANFPLIPGYSWVGRVVEIGKDAKGWKVGELVSGRNPLPLTDVNVCWGGQAGFHRCDPDTMVVKLPQEANPWNYVHAEIASISYRGVSMANVLPNETAVVIGQGMIGLCSAKWLLVRGAKVIVADVHDFRLEPARKFGVTAAINSKADDAREQILSYCPGGADIVVESSANISGAKLAASLLRKPFPQLTSSSYNRNVSESSNSWARLVFQATYHNITVETKPQGLLPLVEGVLVLQPFDRSVSDRLAVVEHIRNGDFPVSDIMDSPVDVNDAPGAYLDLLRFPEKVRGLAFKWKC